MKDLNQVQEALQDKAEIELRSIVNSFIEKVYEIQLKHSGASFYYLRGIDNTEKYLMCDDKQFRQVLINSLVEKYSERMVKSKTRELLNKLELI
jgi:predicted ATP-dependent endonuclease of OLD family